MILNIYFHYFVDNVCAVLYVSWKEELRTRLCISPQTQHTIQQTKKLISHSQHLQHFVGYRQHLLQKIKIIICYQQIVQAQVFSTDCKKQNLLSSNVSNLTSTPYSIYYVPNIQYLPLSILLQEGTFVLRSNRNTTTVATQ